MAQMVRDKNGFSAADARFRSLNPKTVIAICLLVVMGVLWVRVLTRGRDGGLAVVKAAGDVEAPTSGSRAAAARIEPVLLPVVKGRNDVLTRDFFSPANWPGFTESEKQPEQKPATGLSEQQQLERERQNFEAMTRTLNLDAIIQASGPEPARVCIDGKVLTAGQTLAVKCESEKYELTVSEIGEYQVVLTWKQWSAVLKMAQVERVD